MAFIPKRPSPLKTKLADAIIAAWEEFKAIAAHLRVEPWRLVGAPGQPAFQNAWVNYNAADWRVARFFKDPFGIVHIEGLVRSGVVPGDIFTLPEGYRPGNKLIFGALSHNGAAYVLARIDISWTGAVRIDAGGNAFVTLSGITFLAEQ